MKQTSYETVVNGIKITLAFRRLDLRHTWTIARGSASHKVNVFLCLEKDGICGLGEAAPNLRYDETPESTLEFLQQAVSLLASYKMHHFYDLGLAIRSFAPGQNAAKCAFDMAILDWNLKVKRTSLHRCLGLDARKAPLTSYSIGIDTPEIMQQKVEEAGGFLVYKIKLGTERDEEIVKAIRAVTDKPLRVDANEGWKSKEQALAKLEWLHEQNVEFVEQPMPAGQPLEDHAWLRERAPIPILADESVSDCSSIHFIKDVFHGINIKLMKSAGIQEALRMMWLAKSYDLKIMLGCMVESSLAISAAANLSPLVDFADLDGNLLLRNDPYSGVRVLDGRIVLSEESGLGVTARHSSDDFKSSDEWK